MGKGLTIWARFVLVLLAFVGLTLLAAGAAIFLLAWAYTVLGPFGFTVAALVAILCVVAFGGDDDRS